VGVGVLLGLLSWGVGVFVWDWRRGISRGGWGGGVGFGLGEGGEGRLEGCVVVSLLGGGYVLGTGELRWDREVFFWVG